MRGIQLFYSGVGLQEREIERKFLFPELFEHIPKAIETCIILHFSQLIRTPNTELSVSRTHYCSADSSYCHCTPLSLNRAFRRVI